MATWNCLQGAVVPGPADALFLPLGLADPRRALRLALWAGIGAVAGGLISYGIGRYAFESVGRPLVSLIGIGPERWTSLEALFHRHGAMLVLHPEEPGTGSLATRLVPVAWGDRRYLVPEAEIASFRSAVEQGHEPRGGPHGAFYLRCDDWWKAVEGLPTLPDGATAR